MYRKRYLLTVPIFCLLFLAACSAKTSSVKGAVTFKKKNVTHGQVIFMGKDGQPLAAEIGEDGKYELQGIRFGDYYVAVKQTPKNAKSPTDIRKEWKAKGMDPPPGTVFVVKGQREIPAKYEDHANGLTLTVSQAQTTYDIPLTDGP